MKKKTIYIIVVTLCILSHITCRMKDGSDKIIPLPDLSFPGRLYVFNNMLYITHALDNEENGIFM